MQIIGYIYETAKLKKSVSKFRPFFYDNDPWIVVSCEASKLGQAPALPAMIRLGWKWLTMKNTLAYYGTELITALQSFILQARGF